MLNLGSAVPQKVKLGEVRELLKEYDVFVKTVGGKFERVNNFFDKGVQSAYIIVLENGKRFKGTGNHLCFESSGWTKIKDLVVEKSSLLCDDGGFYRVVEKEKIGKKKIVDIEVENEHSYFGNGVLHHNSGKSYAAAQIVANAQKMDILCVWFDSENAADATFIGKAGADLTQILYKQVDSIEEVFEMSELIMREAQQPVLFIWDSVANTPSRKEWESSYDPSSMMAIPARIISLGMKRIVNLLAETKSTFVMLNQLKTNIGPTAMSEPYFTPCGKAIQYGAHLRLFLTSRKAKSHHIFDANENKIGSDLKVDIKKSRFGTEGRKCALKIMWGNGVRICDEESWLEAIEGSQYYDNRKAWKYLYMDNDKSGEPVKFQAAGWMEKLQDPAFKDRVMWIMKNEMIERFANKAENDTFGFKDPDDYIAEEE